MARPISSPKQDSSPPTFEKALGGLETIVEAMENQHLTLEELVIHYEQGSALLSHCESILHSARERIELITLRNQNEIAQDPNVKPAAAATPPQDSDDDTNDIRLF